MKEQRHFLIQFLCLLTVLTAVMVQGFTHVIKLKPLSGYPKEAKTVALTFKTYCDGTYQNYLTECAKRNTGFREFFIRNYNQLVYSCFHKITNKNIIEGENRELFLNIYLNEVSGQTLRDKFGTVEEAKAQARKHVEETVVMMDTLRQHGTDFLFVFAPSKTWVYPEKMPKYYRENISDFNLEEYYIELFKEYDIPHIDLLHYFQSIKDSVDYPLFARTASHWAESTIPLAADTILKKLNAITDYDLPTIQFIDQNVTSEYSDYEKELESNLNLLFSWPKPPLPKPVFTLTDTTGKDRPNLLIVGDSYFDQLMFTCFKDAFNQWDFWQYMTTVYSSKGYWREPISNIKDTQNTLCEAGIVLGISTAPMIYNFLWEFPVDAIKMYQLEDAEILRMMEVIRQNKDWYDFVVKQAEELHLTVEENLRKNAVYYLENHPNP